MLANVKIEQDKENKHIHRVFITPADEKTHGFNRVDDSPQIFNYVQMYILKISTRYAILNL